MKTKIIILLFIIFGIYNNAFSLVVYIYSTAIPITTDAYCGSTHAVKVKWRADQWNNDHFHVLRTTDPNWNSWNTISPAINGCGTCSAQSYEYIDYGPFVEGVHYYYKIEAVSNSINYTRHEPDGSPIIFPIPHSKDWKKQTTDEILIGSTSSNRNDFTWHEESNITQGVRISLIPSEKVPVYIQQNNSIIYFEVNDLYPMILLEVNFNNQGYTNLYQGSAITNFIWENSTNIFNTIGDFNLKVRYMVGSTIYYREYDLAVIPSSQKLYKDNFCNTLRCWQGINPNGIPVVFSEGFDAYDCTTQEFYYWAAEDIFKCLLANGFNVYLLDNKFGTQDIRNNAAGFDAAVRYVSSINNNQLVIAGGASMGGMIARYAFAKAEQDGVPLPASKFVSIDSPQQGAVISKSLQDYKKNQQQGDAFAEHALNNDAAKELLKYSTYDPNSEYSNSIHNLFYNELNSLNGNGYPHLTENISVSFSSNTPNPNSGVWIKIECADWYGNCPSSFEQEFTLESDEEGAGSYLPADLTMMSPVIMRAVDWGWTGLFGTLWAYPWVSVNRTKHPCYIPYNSALDIVNGQSKFDVIIETSETTFHDVVPPDVVEPLINAIIYGNKFLQDQTITNAVTFNNYQKIFAGNNVTNKIPVGDFVIQNGANVTFIAGEEINLEPGFEAGYDFEAYIQELSMVSCNSTLKSMPITTENAVNTLKVYNNEKANIKLYPNPNNGIFTVDKSFDSEIKNNIEIYNTLGNKIYQSSFETKSMSIDISMFPKGIYVVKVFSGKEIYVEKVIFQ